ncbi:MAG TPA: hypothetical protein EYH08_04165 [Pyrodictium sp.]|nr:hypothetical protein [Pyrodictium sp.]
MNIRLAVGVAILAVIVCIAMLVSLDGLIGAVEVLSSSTYNGEFNVTIKISRVDDYYNVTLYVDGVLKGGKSIGFQRYTMVASNNTFFYNSSWSITYLEGFEGGEKRTLIYAKDHNLVVYVYSGDRVAKLVNATYVGVETVDGVQYHVYRVVVNTWSRTAIVKPLVVLQPPPSLAPGLATPAYSLAELLRPLAKGNTSITIRTPCVVVEGYGVEELRRSPNGTANFHHTMYFRLTCSEVLPYASLTFYAYTQNNTLYYHVRAKYFTKSTTQLAAYLDDLARLGKLNVSVDFDGHKFYNRGAIDLLRGLELS